MIYVIATLDVKPGQAEAVKKAARPLIATTRTETGCLAYDLAQNVEMRDRLVFVERWDTRDDLERHFTQPHLAAFGNAVKPLLEGERVKIIESDTIEVI